MSNERYPLTFNHKPIKVQGRAGRPLLVDGRRVAPSPCNTCDQLSMAINDKGSGDILFCKKPMSCPIIATDPSVIAQVLFIDVTPCMGAVPEESPCNGCVFSRKREVELQVLNYCGRAEQGVELQVLNYRGRAEQGVERCPVRAGQTPEEWLDGKRLAAESKIDKETQEFERELMFIQGIDLDDFGSF